MSANWMLTVRGRGRCPWYVPSPSLVSSTCCLEFFSHDTRTVTQILQLSLFYPRSQLNLLQTPLQAAFLSTPDLPWTGENATVRVVYPPGKEGGGAGKLTYVAIEESGHMVRARVQHSLSVLVMSVVRGVIDNNLKC